MTRTPIPQAPAPMGHLVVIHSMDPRGVKVGGIETHLRHLIRHHPAGMRLTFVGIDETGALPLGKPCDLVVSGRRITFLPVLHVSPNEQQGAARAVMRSVTLRFVAAALRHLPALRAVVRGGAASAEVQRYEFAPLAALLGLPTLMIAHNEGTRGAVMDSLLARHWWVHETAEAVAIRLARRTYAVTTALRDRLRARFPGHADRIDHLTVSVDTELFAPRPFDTADGVFRVIYAGRLDAFKDPPLMFGSLAALHRRLEGRVRFLLAGAADPTAFPAFAAIAPFTERLGPLRPEAVAEAMARAHAGVLTSRWEGMPCFLLELLASGRPFGGVRLPQFDAVVVPGVSGRMVEPVGDLATRAEAVAAALAALWHDICHGLVSPEAVAATVAPYSVRVQMGRLFAAHRVLQAREPANA